MEPNIDNLPFHLSDSLIFNIEKEENYYIRYISKDENGDKAHEIYIAFGTKRYI